MREFITHVSDPKIITACTNALKNIPGTCVFALSFPKIIATRAHFIRALRILPATEGQLLSEAVKIWPMYLKDGTEVSGWLYDQKYRSVLFRILSADNLCRFRSALFVHWAVLGWWLFKDYHDTNMSQQGHCEWGRFPSPTMITM